MDTDINNSGQRNLLFCWWEHFVLLGSYLNFCSKRSDSE